MTPIPTMSLRFVLKLVPAPKYGPDITEKKRVLQQLVMDGWGNKMWVDVPLAEGNE